MSSAPPTATPRSTRPLHRLAQSWVAPAAFDFWASRINRTWTWQRPLARIVARHAESRDAVTLWLQPNGHWDGFRPGQHLNVSAEIDGTRVTRSYSLTHAARADGRIAITVKAIAGGKLSRHLCDVARVGDVLDLGPAFGGMVLPDAPGGEWLFLAAGSGITPLVAMTRALAAQGMPVPLTLIYWARCRDELCFADELRALAAAHPALRVRFVLTRETAACADARPDECSAGRISDELLASLVGDVSAQQVFACGPGGFVDVARELLAPRAKSFQAEAFTPPPCVIEDTGSVSVTLTASGRTLQLPRGQSLLTALEAHGLKPASGCRMGICNSCACGKVAGTTRQLHTGDIGMEPVSALRLCVNGALSDLVLDL